MSLDEPLATFHPSMEELFDRWWSNFESLTRPKAERLESLTVEVVLSPEEARRGGTVQVDLPARATCGACGGRGHLLGEECWHCQGQGQVLAHYPVPVTYPPGTRDGRVVRLPLEALGIENFYLTVLLRVSGHEW